jgi:uncharacterized membrane protein HdeD (DUF308 family)
MSTSPLTTLHDVTRLWWLVALFGVIVAGVGIFFVVSPHETLSTFTVIAGIFLLIAAGWELRRVEHALPT